MKAIRQRETENAKMTLLSHAIIAQMEILVN